MGDPLGKRDDPAATLAGALVSHGSSLGPMLEHGIVRACEDQGFTLRDIEWFRSDWQRGGGSTGFATLAGPSLAAALPVVIKLPVGPVEFKWTCALAADGRAPTPRVLACGHEVGSAELSWLVIERLPGPVVGSDLRPEVVSQMLHACALVQARCQMLEPVAAPPAPFPFDRLIEKSRQVAKLGDIASSQVWAHALRDVARALPVLVARWNSRTINAWCHGDLHGGNALRRADGSICLIDLALVHPGHWLEDALYLERVTWSRTLAQRAADTAARSANAHPSSSGQLNGHAPPPHGSPHAPDSAERLAQPPGWRGKQFGERHAFSHHADHLHQGNGRAGKKHKHANAPSSETHGASLLSQLAAFRRELGLACDDDYGQLANTRRVLMASCAPAWIEREGNPRHLAHALQIIERLLPQVAH